MKESNKKYLMYAVMFVVLLIIVTVTSTYAYFQVNVTGSIANSTITTTTDCIDISIANDSSGNISLPFNYPVTDSYATSTITNPVEVQVKNNCSNKVSYSLILTTLTKSGESSIASSKIRYQVKKKIGTGSEVVWKKPNYLTSLQMLPTGNTTSELLNKELDSKSATSSYNNRESYVIDGTSIEGNTTNTYKIYLWVDYYEGDTAMYDLSTGEEKSGVSHTTTYDNSTKGQTFKSAISVITNLGDTIIEDLSGNGNVGINYGAEFVSDGIMTANENFRSWVDAGLVYHNFSSDVSVIVRDKINNVVWGNGESYIFGNQDGGGIGISFSSGRKNFIYVLAAADGYRHGSKIFNYNLNQFYTMIVTYDGKNAKLYINGELFETIPTTGTISPISVPFLIGENADYATSSSAYTTNFGNKYLNKQYADILYQTISDALIFDRALTEEEIKANYTNIPNPVDKTNLLLWYKFTN